MCKITENAENKPTKLLDLLTGQHPIRYPLLAYFIRLQFLHVYKWPELPSYF